MWWPIRSRQERVTRRAAPRPVAEVLEPRILYSADIAAGLMLATGEQATAEHRTLDAQGEYAT
ncbi:MAG: LEPR-XLL domain-containing protein, partial [Ramlibacter sp.]